MTRYCQSIVKDYLPGIILQVFSELKLPVVHGQGLKGFYFSMKFLALDLIFPK